MKFRYDPDLLPEIYNGHSGTHLTIYLPTDNRTRDELQDELETTLIEAEELIEKENLPISTQHFLSPIRRVMQLSKLLSSEQRGGWVLLRSATSFRVIRVPTPIPKLKVISQSFHVKPILRWLQMTRNCYLLQLTGEEIHLFTHSRSVSQLIGSVLLPKRLLETGNDSGTTLSSEAVRWVDEWIMQRVADVGKDLIVVGTRTNVQRYRARSIYPAIFEASIYEVFDPKNSTLLSQEVEALLAATAEESLNHALRDLRRAENRGYCEYSIHQVSEALVNNELARIYVAEDKHLWGMMCEKTGKLSIHKKHMNCYDEDILDDIAEKAIRNGVDIIIVSSDKLPANSPIVGVYRRGRPRSPTRVPA